MADTDYTLQVSGGDYTDVQAWITANDGVTGTHTLNVEDDTFSGDSNINNTGTVATGFVIKPQSGAKHDGTIGSGAKLTVANDVLLWWFKSNGATLTVEDMVLEVTAGAGGVVQNTSNGGEIHVRRCIVVKNGTSTSTCLPLNTTAHPVVVEDNVIYGYDEYALDARECPAGTHITGNTADGGPGTGEYGLLPPDDTTGDFIVANNISLNHSVEDYFDGTSHTNHGSNIASDATADSEWNGAGGSVNSVEVLETGDTPTADYVAFVNLTAGSEDYHLVDLEDGTYDNVAIAGGIASLGSGTDIDGDTRDGSTPDIGADEMAAVGGGSTPKGVFGLALHGPFGGSI